MSPHDSPAPFSEEELAALLRDESVSCAAIVEEMELAGTTPYPAELLQSARRVLSGLSAGEVGTFEALNPPLRELIVGAAIEKKAIEFLSALTRSNDKGVVKEGKRGLHLLKTRGVAVEAPKPPTPSIPPAAPLPMEELPTFMSSVDGLGERVVFFSTHTRNGVDVAQIVISDETGLISAHLAPLSRKEYRRFVQGLTRARTGILAEVPRAYARSLVASSLDLNATARRPVPPNFNDVAFVLGPAVPPQPSPGRVLPPVEDTPEALRRAGELLLIDVLRSWAPPEETLRALALRREEIEVSPLYLDEVQRSAFWRTTLEKAAVEFWTAERRQLWAERLFDTAYLLHAVGRHEESHWALATARALASDVPLESIPFCWAFFETALAEARFAQDAGGLGLPRDAGKGGKKAGEPGAAGGLILPPT